LDDYVEAPARIDDGHAIAPESLGHGPVLDRDRREAIRC